MNLKILTKQTKVVILIVVLIGVLAAYMTSQTVKYNNEAKAPVSATVTAMEEYDDSTSDSTDRGYEVYVDYEYNGKNYEHVFYKKVSFSTKTDVGDKLELEVYERNPIQIAQDTKGFSIYMWVLFAVGVIYIIFRVKNDIKIARKKEQED